MAHVLGEPAGRACAARLLEEHEVALSAVTLVEALVVARSRKVGAEMDRLLEALAPEVVNVTAPFARKAAAAYLAWGKGHHAARLNLGDCFTYALARERNCPLLFVGDDFAKTDVKSALGAARRRSRL